VQPDPDWLGLSITYRTAKGGALRAQVFQRAVLTGAASRLGLDGSHPHALRHTAASLAIASGANVKVVQQMLGHMNATMTLDLYGHLFSDQLDEVADRLDAAARAADVHPLSASAEVVPIGPGGETNRPPGIREV
jgi:integrase